MSTNKPLENEEVVDMQNVAEEPTVEEPVMDEAAASEELTLDDVLGDAPAQADNALDLESELQELAGAEEAAAEDDGYFIEDISGFAKGFPDWDLLPPDGKKKGKK